VEVVKALIAAKADLNIQNKDGVSDEETVLWLCKA
jgi:hypothetical protein